MERPRSFRRGALALGAVAAVAAACGGGSAPPYAIETLRVITVRADTPYAAPGDTVTMRLTYADERDGQDGAEAIEVTWLGGCIDPPGGDVQNCYPALAPALKAIAAGKNVPGLAAQEVLPAEKSGEPDASAFDMAIAKDALDGKMAFGGYPVQGLAYVFFAACAGKVRRISVGPEGGFPLECLDEEGIALGGDSFVVGYTEVYVFADGRKNQNPEIDGLTLNGEPLSDDPEKATKIAICKPPEASAQGCSAREAEPCPTYKVAANVGDIAEKDTESNAPDRRETVWATHFTSAGSLAVTTQLISDPVKGFQKEHATTFSPPEKPGLVTLWAVVHDNRGGINVARGFVRVE